MTTIYFVRHSESNNNNYDDRTRELSEKGLKDRNLVTEFFEDSECVGIQTYNLFSGEELIRDVFRTYGIEDETYLQNCQEALMLLKSNEALQKTVESLCCCLYDTCEYEDVEKIRATSYDELFGEFSKNRFLTNLVVLLGLMKNMDCGWKETIHNILFYGRDGMRVRQMVFLSYIVTDRLVERDGFRFQYVTGKEGANIVLHMTKEARLELFREVFSRVAEELKCKWKLDKLQFMCESWMLSPELADCLPEDSRIAVFRDLFVISHGTDCTTDILKFVFGIYETEKTVVYEDLSETTSLQRRVKEKLINGEMFHFGIGKMEEDRSKLSEVHKNAIPNGDL